MSQRRHRANGKGKTNRRAQRGRDLLRAYHECGDLRARDELVEHYLPLVRGIAGRYARRGEHLEDLIQVGAMALLKAIDRFDVDRGVEFTTYATPTIAGELRRHFRDRSCALHVPRRLQELNLRIAIVIDTLTTELRRSPTISEVALAAAVTPEDVLEALEIASAQLPLSLSAPATGDDEERLETVGDIDRGYARADARIRLEPAVRVLDARKRRIIDLRFVRGYTQSQVALELGISQMHVSRLMREALNQMRAAMPGHDDDRAR